MNDSLKFIAINGLAKTASAKINIPTQRISPAYLAGFRKAASDAGINPDSLIKVAWSVLGRIGGTFSGLGNSLLSGITGNGFGNGWNEGWKSGNEWGNEFTESAKGAGRELADVMGSNEFWSSLGSNIASKEFLENLYSGVRSMGNGILKGVANTPGFFLGAANGLRRGAGAVFDGKGWRGFREGFVNGYSSGDNYADNIGIGKLTIGNAKQWIDGLQRQTMNEYMRRNDIDPTDKLNFMDRMALNGLGIANGAGEGIGDLAGFRAGGAVAKGTAKLGLKGMKRLGGKLTQSLTRSPATHSVAVPAQSGSSVASAAGEVSSANPSIARAAARPSVAQATATSAVPSQPSVMRNLTPRQAEIKKRFSARLQQAKAGQRPTPGARPTQTATAQQPMARARPAQAKSVQPQAQVNGAVGGAVEPAAASTRAGGVWNRAKETWNMAAPKTKTIASNLARLGSNAMQGWMGYDAISSGLDSRREHMDTSRRLYGTGIISGRYNNRKFNPYNLSDIDSKVKWR